MEVVKGSGNWMGARKLEEKGAAMGRLTVGGDGCGWQRR